MYDELVKRLRETSCGAKDTLWWQAADAIEELQKRVPKVPHGRLIDADALAKRIKDEGRNQAEYYADRYAPVVMAYGDCYGKVQSAPTIVEAEDGET